MSAERRPIPLFARVICDYGRGSKARCRKRATCRLRFKAFGPSDRIMSMALCPDHADAKEAQLAERERLESVAP